MPPGFGPQSQAHTPGFFHGFSPNPGNERYATTCHQIPSSSSYVHQSGRYSEPQYIRNPTMGTSHLSNQISAVGAASSYQDYRGMPRPEGPPFHETVSITPMISHRGVSHHPEIVAQILKGFFQVEQKWTCYRRNYFTVSCAFGFQEGLPDCAMYAQIDGRAEPLYAYAVSISAKTASISNQEGEVRGLVQHTPKRDKASESSPKKVLVQPCVVQDLGDGYTVFSPPPYGPAAALMHGMPLSMPYVGFDNQHGVPPPPSSYTFERIQFKKATANNGKRRAQQQFYQVVVELWGRLSEERAPENWVMLATKESYPMVVRGRSPGHYKDNMRRGSQAGMDGNDGTGTSGDGGHGVLQLPTYRQHSAAGDWSASHSVTHQYGGSKYLRSDRSDCSPRTVGSASPPQTKLEIELGSTPSGGDIPTNASSSRYTPVTPTWSYAAIPWSCSTSGASKTGQFITDQYCEPLGISHYSS